MFKKVIVLTMAVALSMSSMAFALDAKCAGCHKEGGMAPAVLKAKGADCEKIVKEGYENKETGKKMPALKNVTPEEATAACK